MTRIQIPQELILDQMLMGPMANFQYFIGAQKSKEVAIVDPGWESDEVIALAKKKGYQIVSVLLTHGHYDHAQAASELSEQCQVPLIISQHEHPMLIPKAKNLKKVLDQEMVLVGDIDIRCIHTPGHTPGCQCFHYKNILLTGDTLFVDGFGRYDLPGGNVKDLYASLNKILGLPDTTLIYPGHDYSDSSVKMLGEIRACNTFLQVKTFNEFINCISG